MIADNLREVRERIADATARAGRAPNSVELLAVSKTWPVAALETAISAGQSAFGENYVQEGVEKRIALADARCLGEPLVWHFIGPLQSNKTALVAAHFDWVHSVDRLKIAERLAQQRPSHLPPLNVCLQVNVSGEATKSGLSEAEVRALAQGVLRQPRLHLRGLMCIPEPTEDIALLRQRFACLRHLRDALERELGVSLDTLSMGMSHDLEAAIAEGATLVRVGTAIFGGRK